jgi:hypothetical protein
VNDNEKDSLTIKSYGCPTFFVVAMFIVSHRNLLRITKDRCRLLKRDSVFRTIRNCFGRIPLKIVVQGSTLVVHCLGLFELANLNIIICGGDEVCKESNIDQNRRIDADSPPTKSLPAPPERQGGSEVKGDDFSRDHRRRHWRRPVEQRVGGLGALPNAVLRNRRYQTCCVSLTRTRGLSPPND